jgi:hypothetical protein
MFLLLVRRWTTRRQWTSLAEWARQRGFQMSPRKREELPSALDPLKRLNARLRLSLSNETVTLLQIQTEASQAQPQRNAWNLLVRKRVKRAAHAAGLRPVNAPASVVDLYGLEQYPSLGAGKRFTVLATTPSEAKALAGSASKTLMPADLGLLLIDDWIVLDFSTRPFDPIELDRMIILAEQLAQLL